MLTNFKPTGSVLTTVTVLLFLTMVVPSCSPVSDLQDDLFTFDYIPEPKDHEAAVLALINQHRLQIGLEALTVSDTIRAVAYSHSTYMIKQQQPSHDYFFNRKHYLETVMGATAVAENVAYGYATAGGLLAGWLNSSAHKRALEGDFTHFELSAEQDSRGRWYYTNIFVKK
jgi:uncharacterized protein YkwD